MTIEVDIPKAGLYDLLIRHLALTAGEFTLYVNGMNIGRTYFTPSGGFASTEVLEVEFLQGLNTIQIEGYWGRLFVDYIQLTQVSTEPPPTFDLDTDLINPNASPEAVALYDYLRSQFGQNIHSGHTKDSLDSFVTAIGAEPAVVAWDFGSYSPMFAYGWSNGVGHVFKPEDYGQVDQIINSYTNSSGNLIPTVQWHWYSPFGGAPTSNTFNVESTTFDVRQAIIPGTPEYIATIRDIDAIAVQLQRLEEENIPIIWRPLHEADGGWFWWGEFDAATTHALYDIMYERLTAYHGLDNLIWCWSRAWDDAEWYPGNDKVDIYGMDSYPGAFDYTTRSDDYRSMHAASDGRKILAMTECGPIPDIDDCFSESAVWSYFMVWDYQHDTENSPEHLNDVFSHEGVVTLDEVQRQP